MEPAVSIRVRGKNDNRSAYLSTCRISGYWWELQNGLQSARASPLWARIWQSLAEVASEWAPMGVCVLVGSGNEAAEELELCETARHSRV